MKKTVLRIICVLMCALLLSQGSVMQAFAADTNGFTPRLITVSVNGDTATSRGFCWYTDAETDSVVEIYLNSAAVTAQCAAQPVLEWGGAYMHKVTVSGLEAGKTYTYRVGNGTQWSETGTFVTDNDDDKVDFTVISDVQASSQENFKKGVDTLRAAFQTMPTAEFYANCGDFTNDSTAEEWSLYDGEFGDTNLSTTIVPVAGNHDGLGVEEWFTNTFNLDTSESVQTKDGVNYSFDYGNIHFAVFNTNDLLAASNAQLTWLKNDMNSTSKDWKIVFMHKSPYSLGKDGKWPDALYLQQSLAGVLDECNVDIVFSGHDHMYLRTKQLTDNKLATGGVTYVLAGTAGSKRYEVRSFLADNFLKTEFIDALVVQKGGYGNYWNGNDWLSTAESNVGGCFSCVSVDGGTLTAKAYILGDESGTVSNVDTYTITKPTGENTATFDGDNTTSELEYTMGIVPSFMRLAAYALGVWLPKFLIMLPELLKVYINEGTF